MNEKPVKPAKVKKPKNKKKIALIVSGIILLLGLIGGAIWYFLLRDTTPPLSDAEFLVKYGTWEKSGAPKVKWIFKGDGKGTLTTNNMINDYEFTWTLEGGILKISTAWLYDLEDEFAFSLNREEESFTVIAKADAKESTFVPTTADSGSSDSSSEENTTEENQDETQEEAQ